MRFDYLSCCYPVLNCLWLSGWAFHWDSNGRRFVQILRVLIEQEELYTGIQQQDICISCNVPVQISPIFITACLHSIEDTKNYSKLFQCGYQDEVRAAALSISR